MGKNRDYILNTLKGLLILGLIVSFSFAYKHYKDSKDIIYSKEFTTISVLANIGGKTVNSPCRELNAKLIVKEQSVTLTFNGDTLSGIPVGVTQDGGLLVRFSENLVVTIYKADPNGDGKELIIVDGPGETLLLSQDSNCEDVTALMDQNPQR